LAVHERIQNFIHQADVIMTFELMLHVHQIFVERIHTPGE
jgi:hypothetical protein